MDRTRFGRLVLVGLVAASGLVVASTTTSAQVSSGREIVASRDRDIPAWELRPLPKDARLRGLAPVSAKVAWVSGSAGTIMRTLDGGRTWLDVSPRGMGTEELQFRDIEATSARHAVALSIGEGTDSRILRTDDGGQTWTETFRNTDPAAFYDCLAFGPKTKGIAVSDPVGGRFRVIETRDAGRSWAPTAAVGMPSARPGEFAFAASGTCVVAGQGARMYLVSGGTNPARFYASRDRGRTWTVADTPIAGGEAAGIFSVAFHGVARGVLVGGDYLKPDAAERNAAWSADGGVTWQRPTSSPAGYRSGAAWSASGDMVLAVGPSGSDLSRDAGRSWTPFDTGSFDAVACTSDGACWASGEKGRVALLAR